MARKKIGSGKNSAFTNGELVNYPYMDPSMELHRVGPGGTTVYFDTGDKRLKTYPKN